MGFRLARRSMTLDDLKLLNCSTFIGNVRLCVVELQTHFLWVAALLRANLCVLSKITTVFRLSWASPKVYCR